jgi:lysophospholipase L1-like esterase
MTSKINRRDFLKLGLVAFLSACTRLPEGGKVYTPTPLPTPTIPIKQTYDADNPNILYTGRIDFSLPKQPRFSAPGVYVKAKFRGTAAAVLLEDSFKWGTNRNYYDVLIDDVFVMKLAPEKTVTRYEVASGLPDTEHIITLVKRTEAGIGICKFLGFEFLGSILPPPARPTRRIEFIGDSITCGTGNEALVDSPQCSEDGWGQPYNNARLSYGADVARNLNADYHLSAVSGIGMLRNYSFQYDARPMPEVYDSIFFEQIGSLAWDPQKFVPDVVVVALGTNDFSPGESDRPIMTVDEFVPVYVQFVKKLRGYFPNAAIICSSSPMLGDNWPTPAYKSASDHKKALTQIVEELNQQGDAKVYKHLVTPISGMGCGTHPNVDQHKAMADLMGTTIAAVMGWE